METIQTICDDFVYQLYNDEVLLNDSDFWKQVHSNPLYKELEQNIADTVAIDPLLWDAESREHFMQTGDPASYLNSIDDDRLRNLANNTGELLNKLFQTINV